MDINGWWNFPIYYNHVIYKLRINIERVTERGSLEGFIQSVKPSLYLKKVLRFRTDVGGQHIKKVLYLALHLYFKRDTNENFLISKLITTIAFIF